MTRWEVISGDPENDAGKIGHIELRTADHEEPTWEVRHPTAPRRRRLDRRTKAILGGAAVAALAVNATAAWAYWRLTDTHTGPSAQGTRVELTLRARSDLNVPLRPGQTGNLTVTVTNQYDFPVRIDRVTPGPGNIVADDEHRDEGCLDTGVEVARSAFAVTWNVARNTVGAFTVPGAIVMRADANPKCDGAVFTVPVRVTGYRLSDS